MHLETGDPAASGKEYRIAGTLSQGITQENAKEYYFPDSPF